MDAYPKLEYREYEDTGEILLSGWCTVCDWEASWKASWLPNKRMRCPMCGGLAKFWTGIPEVDMNFEDYDNYANYYAKCTNWQPYPIEYPTPSLYEPAAVKVKPKSDPDCSWGLTGEFARKVRLV